MAAVCIVTTHLPETGLTDGLTGLSISNCLLAVVISSGWDIKDPIFHKFPWLYFSLSFSPISSPTFSPLVLFTPFPTFYPLIHVSPMLLSPHFSVPFLSPLFLFNVSPNLESHIFSPLNCIPQISLQYFSPLIHHLSLCLPNVCS